MDIEKTSADSLNDGAILSYKNLTFGNELGRGSFGVVYKGTLHETPVAIKQLHFSISDQKEFFNELNVMRRVRHPNCVLFVGATIQPDPMCIVTEYVEKGSLQGLIYDQKESIDKFNLLRYTLDIARGMNYLHHSGIIHLDLTPANVLVTESYTCKVADFGLSKISGSYGNSISNKGGGTVIYTAPEVYKGERITKKVDVYSFGIVLWEMFYRTKPYDKMNQHAICYKTVSENMRPPIKENNKPIYKDMIERCWNASPNERPTFDSILKLIEEMKKTIGYPETTRKPENFKRTWNEYVLKWNEQQVTYWLYNIEMGFLAPKFANQHVNGDVLISLTDEDLKDLGISNFGVRRRLLLSIEKLSEVESFSSTIPSTAKDPLISSIVVAQKHIKKHGCNSIMPNVLIVCSFCNDSFEEFENGWECQTCGLIFHDICFNDNITECLKPSKSPLESSRDLKMTEMRKYSTENSQNYFANNTEMSVEFSFQDKPLFKDALLQKTSFGTFGDTRYLKIKSSKSFAEFNQIILNHLNGIETPKKKKKFPSIFKKLQKPKIDYPIATDHISQSNWEDMLIGLSRVARAECTLQYVHKCYDRCYVVSTELVFEIIAQCQAIIEKVKMKYDAQGSKTIIIDGDRDSIVQLATNVREELNSAINKSDMSKRRNLSFEESSTVISNSLTRIMKYLSKRELLSNVPRLNVLSKNKFS